MTTHPDYIVVGAGSAGAALAARLSEDPRASVLLLEAGQDYASEAVTPPDLLDSRNLASMAHDWGFAAAPTPSRVAPYRRGRVVGGTSSINAVAAMRPRPADFAAWATALNDPQWAWEHVEPWLRQIEADVDAPDPSIHGAGGPTPIRRHRAGELIALQRAFRDACRAELGLPELHDFNDPQAEQGVGPWPMNRRADGTRVSAALAYLTPEARSRPNLAVRPGSLVARVILDGGHAVGVELAGNGGTVSARCAVVLCAGAIGTPAILLRSGVGPAAELSSLGIAPRLDRPGVGARLWDHPAVPVRLVPKPGRCDPGRNPRFQVVARHTPAGSGQIGDTLLVMVSHLDLAPFPELMAAVDAPVIALINAAVMQPRGHGRLYLADPDPHAPPVIELGFGVDHEDTRRLTEGTRLAWRVATSSPMTQEVDRIAGLDAATVASDIRLRDYVKTNVATFCHASGTAPMGAEHDPLAVADGRGRVRGIERLWIADASLMPYGVSVPPNLTSIMLGERVAAWLRADGGTVRTSQGVTAID